MVKITIFLTTYFKIIIQTYQSNLLILCFLFSTLILLIDGCLFFSQVMPQLLNFLSVDRLDASLDWGIVCAYTCKENCATGNSYKEEFVWKQDFHNIRL